MLVLDSAYIAQLNKQYSGGIFLKTVEFDDPDPDNPGMRYLVDHSESIVFNGNTYLPIRMMWDNIKTSQSMPIDAATITVSNLAGLVGKYVKRVDVSDTVVLLRLLHLDLLTHLTGHWQRSGTVLAVSGDVGSVTFTVGRRLGRNVLPRKVYTTKEFPGLSRETQKILS
jgi:hypothetical protein